MNQKVLILRKKKCLWWRLDLGIMGMFHFLYGFFLYGKFKFLEYVKLCYWKFFVLCVIGAHTIRGDARSEHLVVVTFLIAGIAIMKLRYERYDFLLFSLILLIWLVIYFFKAYFNLLLFFNYVWTEFSGNQSSWSSWYPTPWNWKGLQNILISSTFDMHWYDCLLAFAFVVVNLSLFFFFSFGFFFFASFCTFLYLETLVDFVIDMNLWILCSEDTDMEKETG